MTQLRTFYFTYADDAAQLEPFLRCRACDENLCTVEEADELDVLVVVAYSHAPQCNGRD